MNFKNIHIGSLVKQKVTEENIEISRICNFLKCTEEELPKMYKSKSMDTDLLLRWSKLLKYDFFRIYNQHLILYAPPSGENPSKTSKLPQFRKNIYTKEIIDYILGIIEKEEKTKNEIMSEYGIPKTTLYKWIEKYGNRN